MENTAEPKTRGFIDRNGLKYIVIVAMVLDHIAWGFEAQLAPIVCQLFHFVGRLTGPTMAFFLTQGYIHTRNVAKYQLRLGIFAVVSWLPYLFFEVGIDGIVDNPEALMMQSVMYTLFLGITALRVYDSPRMSKGEKGIIITVLCFLSLVGDWPIMDVLAPLVMYAYRDKKVKKWVLLALVYSFNLVMVFMYGWYNLGVLLVPLMIGFCYNGKSGKKSAFNKWFFYIFYPAHLVVIGILKWYVI